MTMLYPIHVIMSFVITGIHCTLTTCLCFVLLLTVRVGAMLK